MTRALGTVLVTGADGFLGTAVVDRLAAAGVPVVATDVRAAGRVAACDVTDPAALAAAMAGVDTVLHLGGVSGPMVLAEDPAEIVRINGAGTANVLDAARRHGVGRVVVASSVDVYGAAPGTVAETTPSRPTTVYGASKVAAEAAMMGFVAQYGLDACALRLGWIFGPGRRTPTTLERVLRAALAGEPVTVATAASATTHYVALADVVDGVLAAATADRLVARVYNITAGPGRPFADVVAAVPSQPGFAIRYGTGTDPVPAGYAQALAERELGFRPRVALADALRTTQAALASANAEPRPA